MRTTVELPEEVWQAAKIRAVEGRTDLRSIVIEALKQYLGIAKKKGGER